MAVSQNLHCINHNNNSAHDDTLKDIRKSTKPIENDNWIILLWIISRKTDLFLFAVHLQAQTVPFGKMRRPLNINHYATKKSAAQSMLDVALLMANSSQLKTVLFVGPQYRFYIPLIVLLSLSITLQVIVGLLLVIIGKWCGWFVASRVIVPPSSFFPYFDLGMPA